MKNKDVILEEFKVFIADLYDKYVLLIDDLIEKNKLDLIVNFRNDFEDRANLKLDSYNLTFQEVPIISNGNFYNSVDAIIRLNLEKIIISERIKLDEYIEMRLEL